MARLVHTQTTDLNNMRPRRRNRLDGLPGCQRQRVKVCPAVSASAGNFRVASQYAALKMLHLIPHVNAATQHPDLNLANRQLSLVNRQIMLCYLELCVIL